MTPRFLADENIDPDLVWGLRRRVQEVDVVRVQDVGLRTVDDPAILEWAASQGRVLITKDIKTMPSHAFERITAGQAMPGVFVLHSSISIDHRNRGVGAHRSRVPGRRLDRSRHLPAAALTSTAKV